MRCRFCSEKTNNFLDLGLQPPSNNYQTVRAEDDVKLPLEVSFCETCWLVQTVDYVEADSLFKADYGYLSSTSQTWLDHSKTYYEMIKDRLALSKSDTVTELASNDGYLLKHFNDEGFNCYGVEPTHLAASISREKNIKTYEDFFGLSISKDLVKSEGRSKLIIGNNVFAHVPDINDFTSGIRNLLDTSGTVTLEFPHVLNLLKYKQYDTIYHEHYSYLSLGSVQKIFAAHGLKIYDAEMLTTHGGSLRVYGCHAEADVSISSNVEAVLNEEQEYGCYSLSTYTEFANEVARIRQQIKDHLQMLRGKSVYSYGAAAKGNTMLNYCGITCDDIMGVFDKSEGKIGKFLPGSSIEIFSADKLADFEIDIIWILPWNLKEEIIKQVNYVTDSEIKFYCNDPFLREIHV